MAKNNAKKVYLGERMLGIVLGLLVQLRDKTSRSKEDVSMSVAKQKLGSS
jgi:hypothetical protein